MHANLVDQLEDLLGEDLYADLDLELELRSLRASLQEKAPARQRQFCANLEGIFHADRAKLVGLFGQDKYDQARELLQNACLMED